MKDNFKSKVWLRRVSELPCAVGRGCQGDVVPHHVGGGMWTGTAKRLNDYRAIPLCHRHHTLLHSCGKESFEAEFGIDIFQELIETLVRLINKEKK